MKLQKLHEARQQMDKALLAMRAGLPEQALSHLKHVMAIKPECADARLLEAQAHLATASPKDALKSLDAHDLYHPDLREGPVLAMTRAQALAAAGHGELAVKLLSKLCDLNPDDERPHRALAGLAMALGKAELATEELKQVLRLAPTDDASRRALAALVAQTQPQDAVALLTSDTKNGSSPAQLLAVARLLVRSERLGQAEEIYEWLLKKCPDQAELWIEAGELAQLQGDVNLAAKRLEKARTIGGGDAATAALATLQMRRGDFDHAAALWWTIASTDPRQTRALAGVVVSALAADRPEAAARAKALLERREPEVIRRRAVMADLWRQAAVGQAINLATRKDAADVSAQNDSPLKLMIERAAQTLSTHAQRTPGRADTHYHLAVCQQSLGDESSAKEQADIATTINPNYAAAIRLAKQLRKAA